MSAFWYRVSDEDSASIFSEDAVYGEWEEENEYQGKIKCRGMMHRKTGEKHGIVQEIWPVGWLKEGSFRNGEVHGLQRIVYSDKVRVQLFKDGNRLATISFDCRFKETFRTGDELSDLSPSHFNPKSPEPTTYLSDEIDNDGSVSARILGFFNNRRSTLA